VRWLPAAQVQAAGPQPGDDMLLREFSHHTGGS
jgi:hypothetical protein